MPASAREIARVLPRPLGLVPTMGALHRGHIALVERARTENAAVAASIFVNPLQFGPEEDYERYPRAFEQDVAMLEAAGVTLLYAPTVEQLYPSEFQTRVTPGPMGECFEGAARPGHFAGVAVVVVKLLNAIGPTMLYLGRKDAQQAAVLTRLVRDLDMPVGVTVCETVREPDGLALSSRNAYLDAAQRRAAPSFYHALQTAREEILKGITDAQVVRTTVRTCLQAPLELEYLEVVDPESFTPRAPGEYPALLVGVARAGRVRLLDALIV